MGILPQNLVTSSSALEAFETVGDWSADGGAALADESTIKKVGTNSLKVTTASGVTGGGTKTVALTVDPAKSLRIWVYVTDVTKVSSIGVQLSSQAVWWEKYRSFEFVAEHLVTGWNYLAMGPSRFYAAGGEAWTNQMVRLRCYAVPVAAQQAVVYFDDLREVVATPAVLWSFDDGYSSIYTLAKPILDDYAYRGTCYVNSDTVEAASRMTWAQLKELDGAGWSIGNHTSNHTVLTTVDQATAETVLGDCDDAIAAQGITRTGKYVGYPNNVYPTATVLAAMSASGMLTGRRGGGYMKTPLPPVNNHILSGYSLEGQTVAWAQSILDEVLADQTAAALMCHSLDANGDYGFLTPAAYEEIVAYAASLGLIDITIDEMYRLTLGTVARPDNLGHGEGYYVPTNFAGTWAKGLYTYLS